MDKISLCGREDYRFDSYRVHSEYSLFSIDIHYELTKKREFGILCYGNSQVGKEPSSDTENII